MINILHSIGWAIVGFFGGLFVLAWIAVLAEQEPTPANVRIVVGASCLISLALFLITL